jgi:dienelactone hydrolase family protein
VPYEGYVYPRANQGFHNDTTPRYDEAAAKLAWQRTLDWFNKYLRRYWRIEFGTAGDVRSGKLPDVAAHNDGRHASAWGAAMDRHCIRWR